jgi:hypothetical protein
MLSKSPEPIDDFIELDPLYQVPLIVKNKISISKKLNIIWGMPIALQSNSIYHEAHIIRWRS